MLAGCGEISAARLEIVRASAELATPNLREATTEAARAIRRGKPTSTATRNGPTAPLGEHRRERAVDEGHDRRIPLRGDVPAREPVDLASVPVPPQRARLVGPRHAIGG